MDKAAISAKNRFFSVKSHIFYTKKPPESLLMKTLGRLAHACYGYVM